MPQSTVEIFIDQEGRNFLHETQQKVVLIRPFGQTSDNQIIAASFIPFGEKTTIKFEDSWKISASQDSIVPGSILLFQYPTVANIGQRYSFQNDGFKANGSTTVPNSLAVGNDWAQLSTLTFGFGQEIDLNNGAGMNNHCIAVSSIPYNETGYFSPVDTLWILTAKGLTEDMVIAGVELTPVQYASRQVGLMLGKYLSVNTTGNVIIHFDDNSHSFQLGPLPGG